MNDSSKNAKYSIVYHYTSLGTFWNIINSNVMWATNIRHSNDSKEFNLGIEYYKRHNKINSSNMDSIENTMGVFFISFCEEKDLLSQWRGYAEKGVSIGFDFSCVETALLKNNETTMLAIKDYIKENSDEINSFIDKFGKKSQNKEKYNEVLSEFLMFPEDDNQSLSFRGAQINQFKLFNIKYLPGDLSVEENVTSNEKQVDEINDTLIGAASRIKHIGFKEEKETRVLVSLPQKILFDKVHYRAADDIMIPYIVLSFRNSQELKYRSFLKLGIKELLQMRDDADTIYVHETMLKDFKEKIDYYIECQKINIVVNVGALSSSNSLKSNEIIIAIW